jgi:predicted ATP-grasp superfamily ATP-dependent carboligase
MELILEEIKKLQNQKINVDELVRENKDLKNKIKAYEVRLKRQSQQV